MYSCTFSLILALDEWVVKTTHRPLYARELDTSLIVHEAGWNPEPVWTGTENFVLTKFRSPHRPLRSDSIYRLSYPGPLTGYYGLLYLLDVPWPWDRLSP
jgi:hypothetical protein